MPTDVDGDIPPDMLTASDYCRHGTFVGGCGYDHMCGWCETGEEPPTRAELDRRALKRAETAYGDCVSIAREVLEPRWGRARTIAWLGSMCFGLTHREDWPIHGPAWSAYERSIT